MDYEREFWRIELDVPAGKSLQFADETPVSLQHPVVASHFPARLKTEIKFVAHGRLVRIARMFSVFGVPFVE